MQDTGIGIAPEDQARIFDEFAQLRPRHPAAQDGSGLGLAIAKRIIEAHEGQLKVVSSPGSGSTFLVILHISSRDLTLGSAATA